MRILFFMSHPGGARNFESTLRGLAERGHDVHLAFDRTEKRNLPGLSDLADSLVAEYDGITSGAAPRVSEEDYVLVSSKLRATLDYMRFSGPEFADAPKLRSRAESWVPGSVKRVVAAAPSPARSAIRSIFRTTERSAPISETAERYVREQEPDAVLATPLLEPGSVQVEFLRAAHRLGIPTCLCVHSWDNLTNKGLIHELPGAVTVWNPDQLAEAVELHGVPSERVVVTGAPAYDHWYDWEPSRSREEFAAEVGLDAARPFVTYLGSSPFIAPDEAGFLVEWAGELREHGLGEMQVLARPHPVNPLAGDNPSQRALDELENIVLYPPAGANPTDEESRQDYFDSLYYCSAAVGVNTSAFLEAAIVGRPVLTVLAPRFNETQGGTLHFRHLLASGGGLLQVATTYPEHAEHLRNALGAQHPEGCVSERSTRFTQAFIRPYGLEQPATPRMIAAVERLAERENGTAGRRSVTGALMARVARRAMLRSRRKTLRAKRARGGRKVKAPANAHKATTKAEQRAAKEERTRAKQERTRAKEIERAEKAQKRSQKEPGARAKHPKAPQ